MRRGYSFESLAAVFGDKAAKAIRNLQTNALRAIEKAALGEFQEVAPERTGRLKSSLSIVPGRVRVGKISSDDDAAKVAVIERGRKRGVTPRGQKRAASHKKGKPNPKAPMLGSKQAPRGMSKPVRDRLQAKTETILDEAIKKFDEEMGGE